MIVATVVGLIENRGYHVSDLVAPLSNSVAQLIDALIQFIGVVIAIRGRFTATEPLHILPPSNSPLNKAVPLVGLLCTLGLVVGLTGCASSGTSTAAGNGGATSTSSASSTSATIEAALPLVRTGSAVATGAVLNFAVTQPGSRTRLANEMYSSANAIYTFTGGTLPTPAQFAATLTAWGQPGDAQYAQYTTAVSALYSTYYAKLLASNANAKTANDLLNAIAGGIEDATQSYVTIPPPPPLALLDAPGTELLVYSF